MQDKEMLIHNLYRQFDKNKWQIKLNLLSSMNEVMLVSRKGDYKITMIVKLEKDEKIS